MKISMEIRIKRVYDPASEQDGYRILIDRLWPRGMTKDRARIDLWLKEIAPSTALRNRYHRGEITWGDFKTAYLLELESNTKAVRQILEIGSEIQLTLLFSSRDIEKNHAIILREYLLSRY